MRSTRWLAFVAVAVVAGGAAEGREKRGRRGKQPEESILDQLVRECTLSEDQQADVRAKIKARDEILAKWDTENAEKMQAAETAAQDAKDAGDADKRKEASRTLRDLRTEREESAGDAGAEILKVLTPEQKAAWQGYLLYQSTVKRYRRAELDEEQQKKIRDACDVAAKELGEVDQDAKPGKAQKAISEKLRWAIDVFVLTGDQREALTRKPARKGKKGKRDQDAGAGAGGEPAGDF
ncbi:MAG: hypothetical protein ACYSU0_10240 [Planctomycetota bacterium]|jgi:hypothetical protein